MDKGKSKDKDVALNAIEESAKKPAKRKCFDSEKKIEPGFNSEPEDDIAEFIKWLKKYIKSKQTKRKNSKSEKDDSSKGTVLWVPTL